MEQDESTCTSPKVVLKNRTVWGPKFGGLKRRNYEKEYIEKRYSLFWDVTQRGLAVLRCLTSEKSENII
jgi:hypothetical protein